MEYASVSLLQIAAHHNNNNHHHHQHSGLTRTTSMERGSYSRLPDLVPIVACSDDAIEPSPSIAVSSAYYDLVSSGSSSGNTYFGINSKTQMGPSGGASTSSSSRPSTPVVGAIMPGLTANSNNKLTSSNNEHSKARRSSSGASSNTRSSVSFSATVTNSSNAIGSCEKPNKVTDDLLEPPPFASPQSTSKLRQTALIVTLASFIIGTGCFPLGCSALVLVTRKKATRIDYKNALIIATMACIVGVAVNALVITYIIMKLERQALQGI